MDLWSSLALFLEKIVKSNPNESIDPRQKVLSSRKVNDLMSNQYFLGHLVVIYDCILDAVTSSGILKAKQKLGRTFNSDKLGGIAFTKISKLTMCSA